MAERRENSVLFSLRELRKIEDDRVKQEHDDARRREDEAKEKVLADERRRREEVERARRQQEDAERARVSEQERQIREEQLRLDEAERKHRVEAQMRLEEQRLKMEIEAKANVTAAKKPKGLIIASGLLLAVVAGLGIFLFIQKQEQDRKDQETKVALDAAAREKKDLEIQINTAMAGIAALDERNDKLLNDYKNASDEESKKRILAEIERNKQEKAQAAGKLNDLKGGKTPRPAGENKPPAAVKPVLPVCKDPNDPLCGVP